MNSSTVLASVSCPPIAKKSVRHCAQTGMRASPSAFTVVLPGYSRSPLSTRSSGVGGYERQEFRGHRIEDGSGFPSWNDNGNANKMVFRSQLADQRKPVPRGYVRRSPEAGEEKWA